MIMVKQLTFSTAHGLITTAKTEHLVRLVILGVDTGVHTFSRDVSSRLNQSVADFTNRFFIAAFFIACQDSWKLYY